MAAEEEEEEEEERQELEGGRGMEVIEPRGRELGDEIEGMGGGTAGLRGVWGGEGGQGGPGIEEAVEGVMRRMGGGFVEEGVLKEVEVGEGMGVEDAVKSEVGETSGGVEQGLERDEDEFSDDDLL